MKATEIRKKSPAELGKLLSEQEAELRNFRFGMSGGHTKDVKKAQKVRKTIARIKTILTETK
jgi:ribosomal protein L29